MSPASMGAEIFTCWRTIEPTLAAVIFVGAVLALVRALLPPKVGQSLAVAPTIEVVSRVPGAFDCWDNPAQPHVAATAQVRSALWTNRMPYPPDRSGIFYSIYRLRISAPAGIVDLLRE